MLQQDCRGQSIDIRLAAARRTSLFPDSAEGTSRAHALVPQLDWEPGTPGHISGHFPGCPGALPLGTLKGKGETNQEPDGVVQGGELEKARHGEPLPRPALQGLERGSKDLGFVTEGKADSDLTPVDSEYTASGGDHSGK